MFKTHKKNIQERHAQIEALNNEINDKTNKSQALDKEIHSLETILTNLQNNHPGLEEVEALGVELENLKKELATTKLELSKIKGKYDALKSIEDIKAEKAKLTTELNKLKTQVEEKRYMPKDIIIVAYTVPNINDVGIDAFIFDGTASYNSSNGARVGKIYKSLGGGRAFAFTAPFDDYIINKNEPKYNAIPKRFITFEEACLALGSNLYLKKYVTASEIHEILMHFRSGFYFYGKTDITLDEFMEIIKNERQDLGSKPLQKLLEKGKTE